jgi:imidazolonepropionase-like amidohydrolase
MTKRLFSVIAFAMPLALPPAAAAQVYAIKNARIVTLTGTTIPNGQILIQDGKIAAVGPTVSIPAKAKVIDAKGLTAYPGMIDAHTELGLEEIDSVAATQDVSELGELNPHVKASSAINPRSEHFAVTRTNGITSALSVPGGGMLAGQGAVINLDGRLTKDMLLKDSAVMVINFPREIRPAANATEQQRRDAETVRKKRLDLLRQTLRDAQAFAKVVDVRAADAEQNTVLRALAPVVKGEQTAMFNVDTAAEIKGALNSSMSSN